MQDDHKNLYNIKHWSDNYFHINDEGEVEIRKQGDDATGVTLKAIVQRAQNAGLQLPLFIRCTEILHDRVHRLYSAFAEAIAEINYSGSYQLVYPIKVNQEYSVVRGLLNAPHHRIGLEAGSKPELMAVMGLLNTPSTIICNGYKDSSYIRAALMAQNMGHRVFIIVEKYPELNIILEEAKRLNVKPLLGVRLRLVTTCAGKWADSGGAKSKFGLNASQVLRLVEELRAHQYLDCLQLIHCHLGSQIPNIHDIRNSLSEVARYYLELRKYNAPIHTIDVGGGLGVDYAGTASNNDGSLNYTMKEYASHILLALHNLCQEANISEPNIISESGRALTAHHAVLISDIVDIDKIEKTTKLPQINDDEAPITHAIWDTYQVIANHPPSEIYNYAENELHDAHAKFQHGVIGLSEKAKVEELFSTICLKLQEHLNEELPSDQQLAQLLRERLAAKIFCNLSFFQSMPDAWAIQQLFPIMPITHLHEPRTMHGILEDLTCDSDGTIEQYPREGAVHSTLLLPHFDAKKPYYLGFFLLGAYQEVLGNIHNLFGETNAVEIKLLENGDFEIVLLRQGDSVEHVLKSAHITNTELLRTYEQQLRNNAVSQTTIDQYMQELNNIFAQSTYLEPPMSNIS